MVSGLVVLAGAAFAGAWAATVTSGPPAGRPGNGPTAGNGTGNGPTAGNGTGNGTRLRRRLGRGRCSGRRRGRRAARRAESRGLAARPGLARPVGPDQRRPRRRSGAGGDRRRDRPWRLRDARRCRRSHRTHRRRPWRPGGRRLARQRTLELGLGSRRRPRAAHRRRDADRSRGTERRRGADRRPPRHPPPRRRAPHHRRTTHHGARGPPTATTTEPPTTNAPAATTAPPTTAPAAPPATTAPPTTQPPTTTAPPATNAPRHHPAHHDRPAQQRAGAHHRTVRHERAARDNRASGHDGPGRHDCATRDRRAAQPERAGRPARPHRTGLDNRVGRHNATPRRAGRRCGTRSFTAAREERRAHHLGRRAANGHAIRRCGTRRHPRDVPAAREEQRVRQVDGGSARGRAARRRSPGSSRAEDPTGRRAADQHGSEPAHHAEDPVVPDRDGRQARPVVCCLGRSGEQLPPIADRFDPPRRPADRKEERFADLVERRPRRRHRHDAVRRRLAPDHAHPHPPLDRGLTPTRPRQDRREWAITVVESGVVCDSRRSSPYRARPRGLLGGQEPDDPSRIGEPEGRLYRLHL